MSFYISVDSAGKFILYRGYNDAGKRIEHRYPFTPKLFVPSRKPTGWKTMQGRDVAPKEFEDSWSMGEWAKIQNLTSGSQYWGCEKYVFQFLQDKFPNEVKFNKDMMNIVNLDIEVYS